MADIGQTADIDTTIAALQQGITAIPSETAIALLAHLAAAVYGIENCR